MPKGPSFLDCVLFAFSGSSGACRVNALSLEAFIVRLYREKNKKGFLKAFSDQPEHITSGLSPLKNIMKELQLRTVHIYPRSVKHSLV